MALLNFEHYLVEYWHEGKGTDWRWSLEHCTNSLDEARSVLRRLAEHGKKARLTRVLETLDANDIRQGV
jgi:hypothetical protein